MYHRDRCARVWIDKGWAILGLLALGTIAGRKTFSPLLCRYLANPDDGKVSVENTKVDGMSDFIAVPSSHPFIVRSPTVIEQAILFIKNGRFRHDEARH